MDKIKIFTIYHKDLPLIQKKEYFPIFVGNALKEKQALTENIQYQNNYKCLYYDNQGTNENISKLNKSVNELSATYWIWKNYYDIGNPEFIGLVHYRRFFIFNESLPLPNERWLPHSSTFCFNTITEISNYIDTKYALEYFNQGYSILTTKKYDAILLGEAARTCKERFYQIADFDEILYDRMIDLVLEKHPEYAYEVNDINNRATHYLFNMFVMEKSIFHKYCDFIFPILLQLEKENKETNSPMQMRAPGFLAEFLTSMFISHQIRHNHIPVKELNTAFISFPELRYADSMNLKNDNIFSWSDKIKIERYNKLVDFLKRFFPDNSRRKKILKKFLKRLDRKFTN